MIPRKLNILVACFSYGGNGGIASEHPDVRNWLLQTIPKMKADPRIHRVSLVDISDTPITMTRNRSVVVARQSEADVLLMVDSDMRPDLLVGRDPYAVPFWDTAFSHLYRHWDRGPSVIAAPYCGPPPCENVYVFRWANQASMPAAAEEADMQLVQVTRAEAYEQCGIQEAAALPTGLCAFDVRAFELTEPKKPGDPSWFEYEYTDLYRSEKGSTEDVYATRNLSLAGILQLGYNPLFCAWSSWAGHWKPKCVGRPNLLTADAVAENFRRAAMRLPAHQKQAEVCSAVYDEIDWTQASYLSLTEPDNDAQAKKIAHP